MTRKSQPKLKVLPLNPTGPRKVPKPQTNTSIGKPFSQRAVKSQVNISMPGIKTQ